jgi:hypothetical protein
LLTSGVVRRRRVAELIRGPIVVDGQLGLPDMPEFRLDPGQAGDFIVFLKSLESQLFRAHPCLYQPSSAVRLRTVAKARDHQCEHIK